MTKTIDKIEYEACYREEILHSPRLYSNYKNVPESLVKEIINKNALSIMYLEDVSDELKRLALKKNPATIIYINIDSCSEALQFEMINMDYDNFQHIENPTKKVSRLAVYRHYQNCFYLNKEQSQDSFILKTMLLKSNKMDLITFVSHIMSFYKKGPSNPKFIFNKVIYEFIKSIIIYNKTDSYFLSNLLNVIGYHNYFLSLSKMIVCYNKIYNYNNKYTNCIDFVNRKISSSDEIKFSKIFKHDFRKFNFTLKDTILVV